jgi:hypothetical protein
MNKESLKTAALAAAVGMCLYANQSVASSTAPPDRSSPRPRADASQEASRGYQRDAWEYKVEEYSSAYPKSKGLQGWLNEQGRDGWEAFSGNAYLPRWTFRRRNYKL